MINLSTHELSAWEFVMHSWKLFFKHISTYLWLLILYFWSFIVLWIILVGIIAWIWWSQYTSIDQFPTTTIITLGLWWIIATSIVVYIVIIYSISVAHVAHQTIMWNDVSIKSALQYARSVHISSFFKLWLIKTLYLIGLTILFIIPWIIYAIYRMFSSQWFIVDWLWYPQALDQSKSLIQWRWWNLFGKLLLIGIISIGLMIAIGLITNILTVRAGFGSEQLSQIVSFIGGITQQIVVQWAWVVGVITSMMLFLNRKAIYGQQIDNNTTPTITEDT